ncbi:MAG: NAD-dependent epimerase/dehydratase family protein, partial [Tenericutes bacterium]|nr:NAD-dependent epimerase/dehydratase family protein [Mycoplasmatota bacterium]
LKACAVSNVKRFVFSSCAVYGACETVRINEGSCVKPLSPYAVDKLIRWKLCSGDQFIKERAYI